VTSLVFAKVLVRAPHVRSFQITAAPLAGWEVSERTGDAVVEQHHYSDWHRVERALTRFRQEISELMRQGWIEA
jgi:hypothetical protein